MEPKEPSETLETVLEEPEQPDGGRGPVATPPPTGQPPARPRQREPAWRMFAVEFNSSNKQIPGEGEKAASYLLTQLGALVNRVFVVGVLTDLEDIAGEREPMWRGRLTDPTGYFYLSAGQYQAEAAQTLAGLKPAFDRGEPSLVAVVGKARVYAPEPGVLYTSIRPEAVRKVDDRRRKYWVLDTCRSMLTRLSAVDEAAKMSPPTVQKLVQLGYRRHLAEGVVAAAAHYGAIDTGRFRNMLLDSLRYILPEYGGGRVEDASLQALETTADEPAVDEEERILRIVAELEGDGAEGVDFEEILNRAEKAGIDRGLAEETLNLLQDKGIVHEPVIGKIRRVA